MTLTGNFYKESLKGTGPIPINQGIYQTSSTKLGTIGQRLQLNDGRVFYYARAGSSYLYAGRAVASMAVSSELSKACTAATTGAYEITVTTSASSAVADMPEGYLLINDVGPGEGHMMKIKKAAANASLSTSIDFTLYDPLPVEAIATNEFSVIFNPWNDVVSTDAQNALATGQFVCGVPPVAVTASYYFWCQTWGPAAVLSAANVGVTGDSLGTGIDDDGALGLYLGTASDTQHVGTAMNLQVDTEYNAVFLRISP